MIPKYGEPVYKVLSQILGLNFKTQVKRSGVEFKTIYKLIDLVSGKEDYLLVLNDTNIRFQSPESFIEEFILFLRNSIKEINQRIDAVHESLQQPFYDKKKAFEEDEYLGVCGSRQMTLLEKFYEFRNKNKNAQSPDR